METSPAIYNANVSNKKNKLVNLPSSQGLDHIWYVSDLHLEFIYTRDELT